MKEFKLEEIGWEEDTQAVDFETDMIDLFIGDIRFDISSMPGQCGAAVLNAFSFKDRGMKVTPTQFVETLKKSAKGKVSVILASAVVGTRLHKLLDVYPWRSGGITVNPNTKNKIQIFELEV